MKKCMNSSDDFVSESLSGIVRAHGDFYRFAKGDNRGIIFDGNRGRRVKIVTGGGYGHLPLFLGFVGKGLCDGIAVGNVFTSPSAETIQKVSKDLGTDQILYLFGNYFGDTMNFEMAKELLEAENISIEIAKGCDDLASAEEASDRRGIAGILFAYKIAGAAADRGYDLAAVARIVQDCIANISSLGVAFSSCTLPGVGKPVFEIGADEMEVGMGIHGEPGISRTKMLSSREIAKKMTDSCLKDLRMGSGERAALLVNGLGSTSREELYILYNDVYDCCREHGVEIVKAYVDEYVTSMEMAGVSLSVLRVDTAREELLNAAAYSPFVHL